MEFTVADQLGRFQIPEFDEVRQHEQRFAIGRRIGELDLLQSEIRAWSEKTDAKQRGGERLRSCWCAF